MQVYEELVARGLIAQVTNEEEIRDMVNNGKATFYIGFDPTADSLHVGHFMALCLMKRLQMAGNKLPASVSTMLLRRRSTLESLQMQLQNRAASRLAEGMRFIQLTEQFIKMASPDYVLKRGYSLSLKDGKIIKHATDLNPGDELVTRFADGDVKSIVKK